MISVLIADDDPRIRDLVRVTLEDHRVHVLQARDATTALAIAATSNPDVILLDVTLPDLSGIAVCQHLRHQEGYTGRIVMLTEPGRNDHAARSLAAGADCHMTKPLPPVRLLSVVDDMLPHAALWAA